MVLTGTIATIAYSAVSSLLSTVIFAVIRCFRDASPSRIASDSAVWAVPPADNFGKNSENSEPSGLIRGPFSPEPAPGQSAGPRPGSDPGDWVRGDMPPGNGRRRVDSRAQPAHHNLGWYR